MIFVLSFVLFNSDLTEMMGMFRSYKDMDQSMHSAGTLIEILAHV